LSQADKSESPEQIGSKSLAAERKLLKRLIISQQDLDHAKKYAELILEFGLHNSEQESEKYLHRGLNVALVVSYWRPFSDNVGSADTLPKLSSLAILQARKPFISRSVTSGIKPLPIQMQKPTACGSTSASFAVQELPSR